MSEIDDGWSLPDESTLSRPRLVTGSGVASGEDSSAADGWPLDIDRMSDLLDLNAATAAELIALPGIGARKAKVIVDRRAAHGPFRSVDELTALHGFGPKLVAALADYLRV